MRARSINSRRVRSAVLAMALAVPLLAVSQPAQANGGGGADGAVRELTPTVSAAAWQAGRQRYGAGATADQAVRAYWTPERMRAAAPVEESSAYLAAVRDFTRGVREPATVDARRTTPLVVPPAEGELGTPGGLPAAINPNFAASHPTARTSGKVFFSMGGGNFVCSGTVVNSSGGNTVWSAGHCIHGGQGGSLASNWQFVPAYDDDLANPAPFGVWTAVALYTMTAWINNSDFAEDMGVAIMNTNGGNHIVGLLGGQGLTAHQGFNLTENAFGYPAEAPFDGGNLYRCVGGTTQESAQTLRIPCDMTRGSSGGGWLLNWDGNWGYLNGVNSRIDQIVNPTWMASPYFDDSAVVLYDFTAPL